MPSFMGLFGARTRICDSDRSSIVGAGVRMDDGISLTNTTVECGMWNVIRKRWPRKRQLGLGTTANFDYPKTNPSCPT
jgi:hypothetical protein